MQNEEQPTAETQDMAKQLEGMSDEEKGFVAAAAHHMGAAVEIPNPVSIELMEAKDLEGKTLDEVAGLHAMLMGIRNTLDAKIAMVSGVWEHMRAMAETAAEIAKMPEHKRKAFTQHLGGSHIVKDAEDVKPSEAEIKAE